MKKVTKTYYVCQYCGYEDTDAGNLRNHEKVCKKRIYLEDILGKWVKMGDSSYFLIMEIKTFGRVDGIRMNVQSIERICYDARELVNKEIDEKGHVALWERWVKAVCPTQ